MNIVSFDIFDTCFVRACGTPEKIFTLLAMEVLGDTADDTVIADFSLIRRKGEQTARKKSCREEVTLEEIYECCDFSGLTALSGCDIAALECKIEREQLIPVFSIRQKIDNYRREGKSIIYISDMYMSEDFIMALLTDNGFWYDGDRLFVSSKVYLSKSTGNLYKYIAENIGIKYSLWLHHGDNEFSDIAVPRKLGIKTVHTRHKYTHYERKALNLGFSINHEVNEMLASVSKGILLSLPENKRYAFACDLIAPLFVPFVFKIMQDAAERGISRLFFLSRDGYILYQTALLLKKYCFPSLGLSYLYASRCALYIAGCNIDDDRNLENDLKEILTEGSNFCDCLAEFVPIEIYTAILDAIPDLKSENSHIKAVERMMSSEEVVLLLRKHISQQKELLIKYFCQESLADKNVRTAIVDLRGTRKCGKIINDILVNNDYKPSFGYYLEVTYNRCLTDAENGYKAFLKAGSEPLKNYYYIAPDVLECYFCASPHKRTTHYKLDRDGSVMPVFNEVSYSSEYEDVFSCNMVVIRSFVEYYYLCRLYKNNDYCFSLSVDILESFATDPEASYLTSLQNIEAGSFHYHSHSIVRKLSFTEIWRHNHGWDKGSFFLTMYIWRNRMKNLVYRSFVKRLVEIFN